MKYITLFALTMLLACTQALFGGTKKEAIDLLSDVHKTYHRAGAIIETVVATYPAIKDGAEPVRQTVKLILSEDSGQVTSNGVLKLWNGESMFVEYGSAPDVYVQIDAKSMLAALDSLSGLGGTPWSVPLRDSRSLEAWVNGLCMADSGAKVVDVQPDALNPGAQIVVLKSETEKTLVYVSSEHVITKVVSSIRRGERGMVITRIADTTFVDKVPAIIFDTKGKTRVKTVRELKVIASKKSSEAKTKKNPEKDSVVAPDFTLEKLDGSGSVTLSELKGKVIVLDFWSTWCGPCRRGLPLLNEYDAEFGSDLVQVFAVNVWERGTPEQWLEKVKDFWKSNKYKTAVLLASGNSSLSKEYGVTGIPTTIVIDMNGHIYDKHVGFKANMVDDLKKSVQGAFNASK